jgi:hypothetical protein
MIDIRSKQDIYVTTLQTLLQLHGQTKYFTPIMALGMAPLRWWMPLMKMDPCCPSTLAAPWEALGILLPRGDLPWACY